MAAGSFVESLQDEATCPICLEYFTEPVTLECGHNFCRACISQCWGESDTGITCPKGRQAVQQRNLRPNRQLANVLEIAKWLSFQAAKGSGVCVERQKALTLFCEEDHRIIEYQGWKGPQKDKIQLYLKILKEERENFQGFKLNREKKSQEYLKQTETERQKILSEFQKLRQFLEEKERLLLAELEKQDKEIVKIQNENVTKLSEEISHLSELISEMEGKYLKPVSKFLQDVRSTLS
ncbi:unnamed protein product, partial [Lepidochelys kempii]